MNPLAPHYSRFRVTERVLLTGHSHQAWPDVGFEAQQRAWLDAAALVDDKWDAAADQAARVRRGFAKLLGDSPSNIALGQNTHELVTRWLSALPLRERRRVVTSDGEFHSIRRQVERLAEERLLDIVRIAARPVETLCERLIAAVHDETACVMVSSVLFETAEMVPGLDRLALACRTHGTALLIDAYHHLNVVPFDVFDLGLPDVFVTGGGYKYCQLGEGNCFLRVPEGCRLRPVLTGWFAEFADLEQPGAGGTVSYGAGAAAFGGATYDPTSHYRGAAVFDFHAREGLTPVRLREINVRQVRLLQAAIESLDLDASAVDVLRVPDEQRGGFLALRAPRAVDLSRVLRARGVYTDARGEILRLGPAPYLDDGQLRDAAAALGEAVRDAGRARKVD